jgi:hypothetical protein
VSALPRARRRERVAAGSSGRPSGPPETANTCYEDNFANSNEKRAHKIFPSQSVRGSRGRARVPREESTITGVSQTGNAEPVSPSSLSRACCAFLCLLRSCLLRFLASFALPPVALSSAFGLLRSRSQTIRSGRPMGLASFERRPGQSNGYPFAASAGAALRRSRRHSLAGAARPWPRPRTHQRCGQPHPWTPSCGALY